ncbi:hypothetical protein D516_2559 [Rhodobacter sp. AKP1]|nr:hypothetical protein D516_2559 [Rhodobacter sp. AKP1]
MTRASPAASHAARSSATATGQSPQAGCTRPPASATAQAPSPASHSRGARSPGTKGVSTGAVTSASAPAAAAQRSPASTPESGPCGCSSRSTGRPSPAKRAGSPFALIASSSTWGPSRSATQVTRSLPPSVRDALSVPPIRRPSPPARIRPKSRMAASDCIVRREALSARVASDNHKVLPCPPDARPSCAVSGPPRPSRW